MNYFNRDIDFTEEHMTQIATESLCKLKEHMDEYEFEDFLIELDLDDSQREFLLGKEESDRCPCCNGELEQETYYNEAYDDTCYYNYCNVCGWNDYPDYLYE